MNTYSLYLQRTTKGTNKEGKVFMFKMDEEEVSTFQVLMSMFKSLHNYNIYNIYCLFRNQNSFGSSADP